MSSIQAGLVAGNAQNEAGGSVPKNRSRFPLSESFFTTERFADYNPCFVMEGVSGDKITLNQPHQVRTYSLKAPLLQNLLKKKDFFMVPMQAILPLNWEKFYTNPVIGDDVPLGVGTGVPNFWGRLLRAFDADLGDLVNDLQSTSSLTNVQRLTNLLKFLVFYEMFYSNGSLMKNLRIGGNAFLPLSRITTSGTTALSRDADYDELFDLIVRLIAGSGGSAARLNRFDITFNNQRYTVELLLTDLIGTNVTGTYPVISLRECLELLRDNLVFSINSVDVVGSFFNTVSSALDFFSVNVISVPLAPSSNPDFKSQGIPLNLARLWAYQVCVAHYYSNDHIDVLYSAELYRQYINSLILTEVDSTGGTPLSSELVFSYNGIDYLYDSLSSFYFNFMASQTTSFTSVFTSVFNRTQASLSYFVSLFGFKKSLRFMDYFTGSRSRPLAIGDANVDTSGSQVGVLDIARKFQATRFYNAVNRSGRKFSAYMKELFGIVPKPDYHNPFYLAHISDVVGSQEIENTGDAQMTEANSVTSVLRSNAARYAFSFEPDRDCIILGISYYDLPRVYTRATERQNFYLDRMDMFNPFMQYIGDQQIYNAELGTPVPDLQPFSYTNRDMEYKQRFNMSAGGFCARGTQLDEWFFPADVLRRWFGTNIGSSFIRSFNSEFDRFYIYLSGYSLGTYFHFIVRYDDRCDASRPMAYSPGILQ